MYMYIADNHGEWVVRCLRFDRSGGCGRFVDAAERQTGGSRQNA